MQKVMFKVPLNELYEVLSSCQYNEESDFCPILVRIVDDEICKNNNNFRYLLQVWTKKGDMVFEKPLRKPISNWNISNDKFVFQESIDDPVIYIVKLFLDAEPFLFKFKLPDKVVKNRVNSYWSSDQGRIVIPEE